MPPRKSLQAFLATARAALTAPPSKRPTPLTFVVGNESADLDSLCSAILLAYFRSHAPPHYALHIPLCNLARDDLALRPEFTAALRAAALTPEDVLTLSELPPPEDLKPGDARWLLVDHNAMTGVLGRRVQAQAQEQGGSVADLNEIIVGCVDHHDDEGWVPRDADPRVIERCGSCTSLVVEHCRATWDGMAAAEEEEQKDGGESGSSRIDAQVARLALAPALVDTHSLGDKTKTTACDERVVAYLEAKLRAASAPRRNGDDGDDYDRAAFCERLSRLKSDIEPLPLRDILRKDYKEWDEVCEVEGAEGQKEKKQKQPLRLGTSSVPRPLAFLVRKAGGEAELVDVLAAWGEERGVDLVVVMTSFSGAKAKAEAKVNALYSAGAGEEEDLSRGRELLVWARTGPQAVDAARRFADAYKEALELRAWKGGRLDAGGDGDGKEWRRCWRQGRLENSRKQVAPMLREAMKRSLNA
ncbi:Exopolyphosphatase [Diatrype stigma]|uniref:Exopolyphosphatase n=1 Tax=Diatrype stigma TaxID=117547 RepID=A0AAN9UQL5_9PEZI